MQAILKIRFYVFITQKVAKLFAAVEKKLSKPKIKKESQDNIIQNIRNLFKLEKKNKATKDEIISDIRNLFGLENEDYYTRIRVGGFYSNNSIEYEINGNRDKNISI